MADLIPHVYINRSSSSIAELLRYTRDAAGCAAQYKPSYNVIIYEEKFSSFGLDIAESILQDINHNVTYMTRTRWVLITIATRDYTYISFLT